LGYKYKIPNEQFDELSKSPFNYKVLKKKEVWGGTLALLAGGIGVSYLRDKLTNKIDIKKSLKVSSKYAYPIVAFPIGFSEEILFRGFLQPSLNEILTPTGGVIASSLIFGAAHLSNASNWSNRDRINYYRFSIPYITLAGAYFGYISYKNNSLKEAIAVHSWYDFVLFALNSIDFGSTIVKRPSFSFGFSF
jgi:membrane protease YdiL (CAAX protease family)